MSKKTIQTGLLLLMLVVPVFLYFLLTSQSENYYDLPILGPKEVSESGDTIYHKIPNFEFNADENIIVSDKDFEDKVYVTDFFFTTCTSICPKMSNQLSRVQEYFLENNDVKILSHTVDPENDTYEALQLYAQSYGAVDGKWYFVTGNKKALYEQAIKGYFVVAGEEDSDVGFVHSERLVLIDKERRIRGFYDGTNKEDVDRLIIEIQVLLHTYER